MSEGFVAEVEGPLDDDERADLIYGGRVIQHRDVPAMHALIDTVDALARSHLDFDPETAHTRSGPGEFHARVSALQRAFATDRTVARQVLKLLSDLGLDPASTWRDRLYLRVLPPGESHLGGPVRRTPPHRDTWGSNIAAQTNWWAPVYPLSSQRTIAFYPEYWTQPIANNSGQWRFEQARDARLKALEAGREADYSSVPQPTVPVDTAQEWRLVPEPGDVLCFSGAQLHAGVTNTSQHCRFSFETRTVTAADLFAGRGAPNIDGLGHDMHWQWFSHRLDGAPGAPPTSESSP